MSKQYPIASAERKPSWAKTRANHPKAPHVQCCLCGAPADYQVWIEVNWFRGDDEGPFKACKDHKSDARALLSTKATGEQPK